MTGIPGFEYNVRKRFYIFNDKATSAPETTVQKAIEDVLTGKADYATIPQENTL